jgi:hypothetical protein
MKALMCELPYLETLYIPDCEAEAEDIVHLASLPQLKSLKIGLDPNPQPARTPSRTNPRRARAALVLSPVHADPPRRPNRTTRRPRPSARKLAGRPSGSCGPSRSPRVRPCHARRKP